MISNLEYYRTFFAVATFRHITRAAEYLCVSQSAVSQSVIKLEQELGCRLFVRSRRGLTLTAEGEALYSHIQHALQEIYTGENIVSRLTSLKSGELQIGATETSLRFFVLDKIRAFKKSYPDIRISIRGTTTTDVCRNLQDAELEVAFLISPVPAGFNFHLQQISKIQDIPVVSSEFPIDFSQVYSPMDLQNYPIIATSQGNTVRQYIDSWFTDSGVMPEYVFTVGAMGLMPPLLLSGLGIGFVAENYVREDIREGRLVQLKTTSLPEKRSLYIATNPQTALSSAAREFIRLFNSEEPSL